MKTLKTLSLLSIVFFFFSCATAKKKTTPELSSFEGKKIALVELEGEPTAKKIVEVSLINQLVQKGTFILIPKNDVEIARRAPDLDPRDWQALAQSVGADYALKIHVLQFDAPIREGYSEEEITDSQLAEERGTDGKTKQIFKVKAMEGQVRFELQFTNLADHESRTGIAEAHERVEAHAKSSAIHLPPKLRFLEKLTNQAFREFFEKNR